MQASLENFLLQKVLATAVPVSIQYNLPAMDWVSYCNGMLYYIMSCIFLLSSETLRGAAG